MPATRLTLDLTGYNLDDHEAAQFQRLFRFILIKAKIEQTRGNLVIPMDGAGHTGTVKVESFHDVSKATNGNHVPAKP